jgi:hypothetical protein
MTDADGAHAPADDELPTDKPWGSVHPDWMARAAVERVIADAPADYGLLDDIAPMRAQVVECR